MYRSAGEAAAAIVQVLEEARQRRRSYIYQSWFFAEGLISKTKCLTITWIDLIHFVLLRLIKKQKVAVQKVEIINHLLLLAAHCPVHKSHNTQVHWTRSLISISLKVLIEGLYDDPDTGSKLGMLRMPNDVRSPVMKMIWDKVTEEWQVLLTPDINSKCFVIISWSELSGLQWRRFCWRGFLMRPSFKRA